MSGKLLRVVRLPLIALLAALGTIYVTTFWEADVSHLWRPYGPRYLVSVLTALIAGAALSLAVCVTVEAIKTVRRRRVSYGLIEWGFPTAWLLYIMALFLAGRGWPRDRLPSIVLRPVVVIDRLVSALFGPLAESFQVFNLAGGYGPLWFKTLLYLCLHSLTLLLLGCLAAFLLWCWRRWRRADTYVPHEPPA